MIESSKKEKLNTTILFRLLLLVFTVVGLSILRSPLAEARLESSNFNDRGAERKSGIPQRSFHQRKYREARKQENKERRRQRQLHQLYENLDEELEQEGDQDDNNERLLNVFEKAANDIYIYVNSDTGKNTNSGSTAKLAVKTLARALALVKNVKRPLKGNLIVQLTGTFDGGERLVLTGQHKGTNKNRRVIFRGGSGNGNVAKILGGKPLKFVDVSSLPKNSPGRKLANLAGVDINKLMAAPPPENFPANAKSNQWTDGDCRDTNNYVSPPTLSINGKRILTRAREPNLPKSTTNPEDEESMGEVLDAWLRTARGSAIGETFFKLAEKASINKASDASWKSGSVWMHQFSQVDWYDARVPVGQRFSNRFKSTTKQKGPGDPNEGNKFRIVPEARYYLDGAIEYLDSEGEYFVSLGETIANSYGWTLFYPPSNIKDTKFSAVLSLNRESLFETDTGADMFVTVENVHFEASKRYLGYVYANEIEFNNCKFVNAGHDGIEVTGQHVSFRNCVIEGTGGSSIRMDDDRDIDTDGYGFALLESGNAVMDSLLSDFASTCRHYSEGVALGGYGTIISNNQFRSSNMAAIDLTSGGTKIKHNIFSHISDGSYDDGAIHWVASSPMERGSEVSYNVFFRNGVSEEPCNAETSCYQADIYMDDSAGAMIINGNVMIKDKVLQDKPPNNKYSPIQWLGILINGGADVMTYDNTFLGPVDDNNPKQSAIYRGSPALYEQTCGGTIWPDSQKCGVTGICANDEFYKLMRQYKYTQSPWKETFPELSAYNANPSNNKNPTCASQRSCPVAAWNQTVICNAAIGSNRAFAHRVVWPTDKHSDLYDDAIGGRNVPIREKALIEKGNKPGSVFAEDSVTDVDKIEIQGVNAVIEFAQRVATAGEATSPGCAEGTRRGGARLELAGRLANPCTESWIANGIDSCNPCTKYSGSIVCAPRDLPAGGSCSCNHDDDDKDPPTPAPTPAPNPPTPAPKCLNRPNFRFNKKSRKTNCAWAKRKNKCNKMYRKTKKFVKVFCPQSCGFCPNGCDNCEKPDVKFKVYRNSGYCNHKSDQETKNAVNSPQACWAQCKQEYNRVYAEYTDGGCFCTSSCPCMTSVGNTDIITIVPKDFNLPKEC